jgi:hypothetical protein
MFSAFTTVSHLIGMSPQLGLPPGATAMEVKMASKVISARGSRKLWASLTSWFVRVCRNSLFHVPKPSNIGNRQQDEAAEYYGVGCERGDKFYFSAFAGNGLRLNPVAEAACGAVVHGLCLRPIDSRRNAT